MERSYGGVIDTFCFIYLTFFAEYNHCVFYIYIYFIFAEYTKLSLFILFIWMHHLVFCLIQNFCDLY